MAGLIGTGGATGRRAGPVRRRGGGFRAARTNGPGAVGGHRAARANGPFETAGGLRVTRTDGAAGAVESRRASRTDGREATGGWSASWMDRFPRAGGFCASRTNRQGVADALRAIRTDGPGPAGFARSGRMALARPRVPVRSGPRTLARPAVFASSGTKPPSPGCWPVRVSDKFASGPTGRPWALRTEAAAAGIARFGQMVLPAAPAVRARIGRKPAGRLAAACAGIDGRRVWRAGCSRAWSRRVSDKWTLRRASDADGQLASGWRRARGTGRGAEAPVPGRGAVAASGRGLALCAVRGRGRPGARRAGLWCGAGRGGVAHRGSLRRNMRT